MLPIKIKKLQDDAILPTYAHYNDAGADLYATENVLLLTGDRYLVGTGIAVEIPDGYVGLIHPRSGLAHKAGITVLNSPGTVDAGYRGEIKVNIINLGKSLVEIEKGDRIAQIVFQKVETAEFTEVAEFEESIRGTNGHGSTGSN